MLKVKSKSEIFREAWQIAKDASSRWGGSARSYLAAALRTIYAELRNAAMRAAYQALARKVSARVSAEKVAITNGVYEVLIAVNTPSNTIVDQAVAVVSNAISTVVAKVSTFARKAFGFAKKVFDFTPKEVALE